MLGALAAHCPDLRYAAPRGGTYLWVQLPPPLLAHEVEAACSAEGVSVRGGDAFMPDGGASSHIRLCYAAPAMDEIPLGVQRLAKALRTALQRRRNPEASEAQFASV